MDMRNLNGLSIKKTIVHILNNKEEELVLNDFIVDLPAEVENIIMKHIKNSINDKSTRIAKFNNDINVVREHCQKILSNPESEFIRSSQEIAKHLYESMKPNKNVSPANFTICLYSTDNGNFIALLKMDFSKVIETNIEHIEGKTKINVVIKGKGMPDEKQKLQKCVFFKSYEKSSEYDIILLDKQAEKAKKDELVADFFADNFLHCELAKTNRDCTRNFKKHTEAFFQKNYPDDIEKMEELKKLLIDTLKVSDKIDIENFADTVFGNNEEVKEKYKALISEKVGDYSFDIDKDWVRDNLKKKKYKTNTGVEINIDVETASNPEKFEIKHNENKTVNIIIKNVENYSEKIY